MYFHMIQKKARLAMNDILWRKFLIHCRQVLGEGASDPFLSRSWCAYTTFSSLEHGVYYFNSGFPDVEDCHGAGTADGSIWRQSISYGDLAHVVIPAVFYWEKIVNGSFTCGYKEQDLTLLSAALKQDGIQHRVTEKVLEIKLY